MIIMDGSGSMWGQIDGKSKMSIARTALRDLVDGLPSSAYTGLMAYGHRRKGDCSDIEILQSPAPGAKAEIIGAVDAITPTGKTPLSAAVKLAAEQMKYKQDRATVILITDGIETCDIDPCALGDTLEEQGIDFTTHIVGFGLSKREGRQVACLATATGGQYIEAANAGELSDAMEQVAEAVEEPPEEPIGTAQATLTVPKSVPMGTSFEVRWTGPENLDHYDYIDLVPTDYTKTSSGYLSYFYAHQDQPQELRAPAKPGQYKVRYVWVNRSGKNVIAEEVLEVVDADVAIFAPETVGIGQKFEITWRGPGNKNDYVDMVPPEQTKTSGEIAYAYTRKEILEMTAPGTAGPRKLRYVASGSDGKRVMVSVPIMVEEVRAEVAFNPSTTLGSILEVSWTGPDAYNDYIDVVSRGDKDTKSQLSYAYTKRGSPAELKLPSEPGEYDIRYILSASDGKRILARAPLTLTDAEVSLDFAAEISIGDSLEVAWVGPGGRSDYIDLVARGEKSTKTYLTYSYVRNGSPVTLRMPGTPGDYDVRYVLSASDAKKVLLVKPLSVTAATITLDFPATIALGKKLEVEWTGTANPNSYVDIVARGYRKTDTYLSYRYTRSGNILELNLPAQPGDYDVRFILSASDGKHVVLVKPLTISDVSASLDAPASAKAGEKIEVSWQGPGGHRDFIDVVPRGKKLPEGSLTSANIRAGNPVNLKLPAGPGAYDIRYILVGSDKRVVKTRREIEVK